MNTNTNDALRDALQELVDVKDLKEQAEAMAFGGINLLVGYGWEAEHRRLRSAYIRRQPKAWDAARAALAATSKPAATFMPPALHEGIVEHTIGTYSIRIAGLTIRNIKEIFEDKYHGSLMWSSGAAYPTDGVTIQFINEPATQPALKPLTEDLSRLNHIAELIGIIYAYGNFKAETYNEVELEKLLRENGTFWNSYTDYESARGIGKDQA